MTPNQSRITYDVMACSAAALVVFFFARVFLGSDRWELFATPALVVLFNRVFGIYTRLKVGDGITKAIRLTASTVLSAGVLVVVSRNVAPALLWALLIWAPLALPRLFLNLNTRVKTNFISNAIQNRGAILVVGGAGYIGTHVVVELLKADYPVRVLDKLLYGKEPLQQFVGHPKFELVEGDATDIVKLVEAMNGASAVVHLGGLVGDPACSVDESFTRHANVIATRMVKEVAISLGVHRFIFASSCSVYGASDQEVSETSDLNPVSLYARTKIDSERELLLCPAENFLVTILRFATVFGHSGRARFDLVGNLFTAQAMIDGKITLTGDNQWRPFVHVRDLARAVVAVLKADPQKMRGQVFNVGDKRFNMTIGALAEEVKRLVSKERPVEIINRPDVSDRRNYIVNFDKIRSVLGFQAATTLEMGIEEIVAEFKKGTYGNYRDPAYSNLEMTKVALSIFQDPQQASRLYGPLTEFANVSRPSEVIQAAPQFMAALKSG
jgi:nucleoside-diphosphate-sugar epimerase